METKLTVFFDDPFWVGVFERIEDGKLSVTKITFGAEPKDYEVWEFVLKHYYELEFSPAVETVTRRTADNPSAASGTQENNWNVPESEQSRNRPCRCSWSKTSRNEK